jgi:hypothetical protein
VRRACRGFRELRDKPVLKDRRGRKVLQGKRAIKAIRVIKARLAALMSALFRVMVQ